MVDWDGNHYIHACNFPKGNGVVPAGFRRDATMNLIRVFQLVGFPYRIAAEDAPKLAWEA